MAQDDFRRLMNGAGVTVRPMTAFPHHSIVARAAQFKALWVDTVDLLDRELHQLDATDRIIEVHFPRSTVFSRRGFPYAEKRDPSPPIVFYASTNAGSLRIAVDTFDHWRDNVRALALGLEALRKVERYGIAPDHEQYRGYTALPPSAPDDDAMDAMLAAKVLSLYGGGVIQDILAQRMEGEASFKVACRVAHPDHGGTDGEFRKVLAAREALRRHWKEIGG